MHYLQLLAPCDVVVVAAGKGVFVIREVRPTVASPGCYAGSRLGRSERGVARVTPALNWQKFRYSGAFLGESARKQVNPQCYQVNSTD